MDRKLFLSYIQNLQTNNPDMIGFQNSLRKNSWQKPRSIVEMNGGGHVNQDEFDAEDRRRQSVEDAVKREVEDLTSPRLTAKGTLAFLAAQRAGKSKDEIAAIKASHSKPNVDLDEIADSAYHELVYGKDDMPGIEGEFHGFEQNPNAFHSGQAPREITHPLSSSKGKRFAPVDAGVHLEGHLPKGISDEAREQIHGMFVDALNRKHDSQMSAQKAAEEYEADQDLTDMQAHTLERQGRTLKTEATLRTHPPMAYGDISTYMRQMDRTYDVSRITDALMDPTHPINADPANADEKNSLIRVLTDMGHFIHKQSVLDTDLKDMGSDLGKEFTGPSARDTTKTGPGTQSANVQDLRRFVKFKDRRVYQKPYFGQSPIGYIEPTDE